MAEREERRAKLLAKFKVVARERIARVGAALSELERGDGDEDLAKEMMREIHTLKGESRLMGFNRLNELAHLTEDLLIWGRAHAFQLPEDSSDLVYVGLDLLTAHLEERDEQAAELARGRDEFATKAATLLRRDEEPEAIPDDKIEQHPGPEPSEPPYAKAVRPTKLDELVRVPADTLNLLTAVAGDLILRQQGNERLLSELLTLSRRQSARAQSGPINGAGMAGIVRRLRDESFETKARLDELEHTVRRLRLLGIQTLFERYPAAIRELAREQGKRVRVVVERSTAAVDRQVLERLDECLLHLIRNCVDHGIEPPDERVAAGKPKHGTVFLGARQVGSQVEVSIRDDGRGIDAERARSVAVERGLLDGRHSDRLDSEAVLELVFQAGFSTRGEVTDLSGRGVGLDVVKRQVEELGGSVRLATRRGRGTGFTMLVPVSVALIKTLVFRCNSALYAVSSIHVSEVLRVRADKIESVADRHAIRVGDRRIPLIELGQVVGGCATPQDDAATVDVVVLGYSGDWLAVRVDSIVGERQAVQYSLGRFLAGARLAGGAVAIEGGRLAIVLNVPEVVRECGEGAQTSPITDLTGEREHARSGRILIVEDSEITRDMLVSTVRRLELETVEAVDGRDALLRLETETPDLILTDLDMPVMNGFELIEKVRAMEEVSGVPIVVFSTRGSDEDKRRALGAGANGYLVKAEFSEKKLQEVLEHFLRGE